MEAEKVLCDECGVEVESRYQRPNGNWVCRGCLKTETAKFDAGKIMENYRLDETIYDIENRIAGLKAEVSHAMKMYKEMKAQKNGILKDIREGQKSLF